MSYLQRKTNYAYGLRNFLQKEGFDVGGKGKKLNEILVAYLKQRGEKWHKWNPKYKGLNTADLMNSVLVQEDFQDFKKWVLENKEDLNAK